MSDRPSTEDMILSLRDARLFFIERGLRDAIADRLEELSAPGKRTIESPAEYVRRLNEENLELTEKVKELSTTATGICAYCGEVFQGDRTETTVAFVNHVTTCPKHPLASALKTIDELKEKVQALEAEEVEVVCWRCKGKGFVVCVEDFEESSPEELSCGICEGTGKIKARRARHED